METSSRIRNEMSLFQTWGFSTLFKPLLLYRTHLPLERRCRALWREHFQPRWWSTPRLSQRIEVLIRPATAAMQEACCIHTHRQARNVIKGHRQLTQQYHLRCQIINVWPMKHLHPRCLDRPLGPSFWSDGPVVYPANAFDSRLRGDLLPLGSSPTKSQKKTFRVGGPQSPFSISSSFILFFVLLPFFLNTKTNKCMVSSKHNNA